MVQPFVKTDDLATYTVHVQSTEDDELYVPETIMDRLQENGYYTDSAVITRSPDFCGPEVTTTSDGYRRIPVLNVDVNGAIASYLQEYGRTPSEAMANFRHPDNKGAWYREPVISMNGDFDMGDILDTEPEDGYFV